ncbi:MAG: chemotaxis protein CheW [Magnetospirillum sp. WYHS-4]
MMDLANEFPSAGMPTRKEEKPVGPTVQLITFTIGDEEYGVDIMAVREIRAWAETTLLPNTPKYVRGVINLRGTIVPIYDLRARFGMGATDASKTHVVIVVGIGGRTIGILVDTVSDILTVTEHDVRPVPDMELTVDGAFLSGLITVQDHMVALIQLDKLFDTTLAVAGTATKGAESLPSPGT